MKYKEQIEEGFKRLGFSPRDQMQVNAINDIVIAAIDDGKKNIILSAPTGVGKSMIAVNIISSRLSMIIMDMMLVMRY